MHAGDGNEALRPYTYWNDQRVDKRVDSLAKLMALAWGNHHIIIDTSRPRDPAASVYTTNTANLRGKPASHEMVTSVCLTRQGSHRTIERRATLAPPDSFRPKEYSRHHLDRRVKS